MSEDNSADLQIQKNDVQQLVSSSSKRGKRWIPTKRDKEIIIQAFIQYNGELSIAQLLQIGDQINQPSQRVRTFINNHKSFLKAELAKNHPRNPEQMNDDIVLRNAQFRPQTYGPEEMIVGRPAPLLIPDSNSIWARKDGIFPYNPFFQFNPVDQMITQYPVGVGLLPNGVQMPPSVMPSGMIQSVTSSDPTQQIQITSVSPEGVIVNQSETAAQSSEPSLSESSILSTLPQHSLNENNISTNKEQIIQTTEITNNNASSDAKLTNYNTDNSSKKEESGVPDPPSKTSDDNDLFTSENSSQSE